MTSHGTPEIGKVDASQRDGSPPECSVAGAAPGESGVAVSSFSFRGDAHLRVTLRSHLVSFPSPGLLHCRHAGEALTHDAPLGSVAIHPAGLDCSVDAARDLHATCVVVDPATLSLAAAEDTAIEAQLPGSLHTFDVELYRLGDILLHECREGYPRGTIFWNESAARLIGALVARHMSGRKLDAGGVLDAAMLQRLRDYIMAHLDEPLDVGALARLCGRSQFHFSRVFARSVGVSPYRYVVHLRLTRAVELIRARRLPLAEVAHSVGFADQSHLTRWVRRVYGVTPSALAG